MPRVSLLSDEVRGALGKVKRGKQPGPDGIKGEIYRCLQDSERLVAKLTGAYNAILEDGMVPRGWKKSRTV